MGSESHSFSDALAEWSVAGRPNKFPDYLVFARVAEVLKKHTMCKARELVVSAARRPLLYTYASDGTPLRATATFTSTMGGAAAAGSNSNKVQRRGGDGTELLVQRGYIVTHDGVGKIMSAPLLRDAVPLSAGKDHWRMFLAAKDFLPHLRMLGHQNICLTHVAFDRAAYSSLSRVLGQRQAAYYKVNYGDAVGTGAAFMEQTQDWFLATACAAHDCQMP